VRILVTGGAGFIGSHYVRSLVAGRYPGYEAAEVTVLDKLTYAGNPANLDPLKDARRLTFVQGDIADEDVVDRLVAAADAVVHFAAESHVDRSIVDAQDFVRTNVDGTHRLVDAARRHGVERFVHISTDEVYGPVETGSAPETAPLRPSSPYAATKAGSDLLALAYATTYGVPVSVLRSTNTYGPYQFPEKVIPLFVTRLMDGRRVPLYGDGLHRRQWLHVDDHCRGVRLVLERGRPGEVYNLGGDAELSNRDLTSLLLDACGADAGAVEHVADRKGHDRRYSVDDTKITSELGYRPHVPFADGLARTVAWYRENRSWWEPLKARATLPH
jgi:dTDP-glucose 4,6-dehydratase